MEEFFKDFDPSIWADPTDEVVEWTGPGKPFTFDQVRMPRVPHPPFKLKQLRTPIKQRLDEIMKGYVYDDRTKEPKHAICLKEVVKIVRAQELLGKFGVKVALTPVAPYRYSSVMSSLWDPDRDQVMTVSWSNETARVLVTVVLTSQFVPNTTGKILYKGEIPHLDWIWDERNEFEWI